jgi:hypothetical protein
MPSDWNALSDATQIELAQQALSRATATLAVQAEVLADEFARGNLADYGGADALRLFAAVVRAGSENDLQSDGISVAVH